MLMRIYMNANIKIGPNIIYNPMRLIFLIEKYVQADAINPITITINNTGKSKLYINAYQFMLLFKLQCFDQMQHIFFHIIDNRSKRIIFCRSPEINGTAKKV